MGGLSRQDLQGNSHRLEGSKSDVSHYVICRFSEYSVSRNNCLLVIYKILLMRKPVCGTGHSDVEKLSTKLDLQDTEKIQLVQQRYNELMEAKRKRALALVRLLLSSFDVGVSERMKVRAPGEQPFAGVQ